MKAKLLCTLCIVLLGTSGVLADQTPAMPDVDPSAMGRLTENALVKSTLSDQISKYNGDNPLRDPINMECPGPSLYSVLGADGDACSTLVPVSDTQLAYNDFQGVFGPIIDIHWWGAWANDCNPGGASPFDVTIYFDDGSGIAPDLVAGPVCIWEHMTPAVIDTGEVMWLGWHLYRYDLTGITCGPLDPGQKYWVEIHKDAPHGTCIYYWAGINSGGDGAWWDPDGYSPGKDWWFCLTGTEATDGSCCNDVTGVCEDHVEAPDCIYWYQRWTQGTLCADLSPECGAAEGACCFDDGSCQELTFADCEPSGGCRGDCNCDGVIDFGDINPFVAALGIPPVYCDGTGYNADINGDGNADFGDINPFVDLLTSYPLPIDCPGPLALKATGPLWQGPGTQCPDDCCIVLCPVGGVAEGEPGPQTEEGSEWYPYLDPDDWYDDVFNGGCNMAVPTFSPIACDQTICGTSGTWWKDDPNNPDPNWVIAMRDLDWYEFTFADPNGYEFVFTVEAEFQVNVWFVNGDLGCPGTDIDFTTNGECMPATITSMCMQPGTYWFIVGPADFWGTPCGADYTATLTCVPCEPCVVVCPPETSIYEQEICGEHTNDGCYMADPTDPNSFEYIECSKFICGNYFGFGGDSDDDFWVWTISQPMEMDIYWESQFPARVGFYWDEDLNTMTNPVCSAPHYHFGANLDPCVYYILGSDGWGLPGNMFPAGYYWFWPWLYDGTWPTEGYPCDQPYYFIFDCKGWDCPDLVTCGASSPPFYNLDTDCNPAQLASAGCDMPGGGFYDLFQGQADPTGVVWCGELYADTTIPAEDTDWWEFTLTNATAITFEIQPEFPLAVEIYDGSAGCPATPLFGFNVTPCVFPADLVTLPCFPAGTYYMKFAPQPGIDFGCLNYQFFISNYDEYCTPCEVVCSDTEGEPCGTDSNGGCDGADPNFPQLGAMSCDTWVCANTWATGGAADTDWFELVTTADHSFTINVETEVWLNLDIFLAYDPGQPISCANLGSYGGYFYYVQRCVLESDVDDTCYPAGTYWIVVWPGDSSGNEIYEYFPCGGPLGNDYRVRLDCNVCP